MVSKCLTEPLFISSGYESESEIKQLSAVAAEGIAKGIESFWVSQTYQQTMSLTGHSAETHNFLRNISTIASADEIMKNISTKLPVVTKNDLPGLYDEH